MSESPRRAAAHARPRSRRAILLAALVAALVVVIAIATAVTVRLTAVGGTDAGGSDRVTSSPPRSASPTPRLNPSPTPTPAPTVAEPAPPPEEPAPPPPPQPVCADDVLVCVNIARTANGLGELVADGSLNAAAQECADRLALSGQLTHSEGRPGGFSYWGENIAVGYPSAAAVFEGWMNSDGHRANILNPNYTSMGIAYASGDWWCQQFGG